MSLQKKYYLTLIVLLSSIGNTMSTIATITTKGQVAIPKAIRDYFNLKPSDKLRFTIEGEKIIAQRALNVEHMLGFIKAKKKLTRAQEKKIIEQAVIEKYERNGRY